MSKTYRYGIQQRWPSQTYVRDVSIDDPPQALVDANAYGMAMLKMDAVGYNSQDWSLRGPTGVEGTPGVDLRQIVLFEFATDMYPLMVGVTITKDHLDALVKLFDADIKTSLPADSGSGGKHHHK